jgi:hypothetical protein
MGHNYLLLEQEKNYYLNLLPFVIAEPILFLPTPCDRLAAGYGKVFITPVSIKTVPASAAIVIEIPSPVPEKTNLVKTTPISVSCDRGI